MNEKQEQMIATMQEVLQEDYLHMSVKTYTVTEDLEEGTCRISCELRHQDNGERMVVEGEGVGTIDALFNAIKTQLAEEYPSLRSIRFSQFTIQGLMEGTEGLGAQTSAQAEATVGITNSQGREFIFKATAPSISHAGIQATVHGAEYFVNSERTFVKLHEILEHYREENRTDLVQKYTSLMSQVVQNTSYSEVVERIRQGSDLL